MGRQRRIGESPFPLRGGKDRMGVPAQAEEGPNATVMQERSRRLRREMTPHERILWQCLRGGALGCRFRRQHVLGRYIVDFICLEKRLVIEVDGHQHAEQQSYDLQRSRWLNEEGYRVLRFTNSDVQRELDAVVEEIHRHVTAS